jgi:hypothetical protein
LLFANLRRAARGRRMVRGLRRWLPPQVALAMLDLGGGRAVAWNHRIAVADDAVGRCKNWLDRRWLRARTPHVMPPRDAQSPSASHKQVSQHRAGGTLLSENVPTR